MVKLLACGARDPGLDSLSLKGSSGGRVVKLCTI